MAGDYFELRARGTSVRTEVVAGVTTFLTMTYVIFLQPEILSEAGMDKHSLIAVTCIISGLATLATGLIANAPIAMAPGMGLNAFFAYSIVLGDGVRWETALGAVFVSGVIFFAFTVMGLRRILVEAIPRSLVSAIGVGIGLFITFMGLAGVGIVVGNPKTIVSAGKLTPKVLIGLAGLLVMIFIEMRKIKGALLAGIIFSTLLAAVFGYVGRPAGYMSLDINISAVALKLDILGSLKWGLFGAIFTLTFLDMFDSIGTLVACCHQAKMADSEGRIRGLDRLLAIDAIATVVGAVLGTSTTTSYAESAAGIEQGGRTGLTSIVTGILFLLALLFVPVVGVVPKYATAPALIMVGLFMMKEIRGIDFTNMQEAFPAFIIIVMIALSYSISTGLAFGFISFVLIKTASGRIREVKPAMWVIAVMSVLFLAGGKLGDLIKSVI